MKTDLSKYNNDWYKPGNKFIRFLWFFVNDFFLQSKLCPFNNVKVFLLRIFGAQVGSNVIIKPGVNIKYPWRLKIGNHVWIGEKVWIDNLDDIIIGDNVCLSQGSMLLCGSHNYKSSTFDLLIGKIIIEDGVWIGAKSVVLKNVTCKNHSVLSVNSVASSNLDEYSIYRGNPAVRLKDRV